MMKRMPTRERMRTPKRRIKNTVKTYGRRYDIAAFETGMILGHPT